MIIPNCTLTTACFCFNREFNGSRPLHEMIEFMLELLKSPVYLVIYGDEQTIPLIREKRTEYGFDKITVFVETSVDNIWSFQYLEKVRKNRMLYHPTRDLRTNEKTHLVTCNKFKFVLQTIAENPFKTTRFGWIDAFTNEKFSKICENYEPTILPQILNSITDKFHLQILNVCDKKYKLKENKREYYSVYQWLVCGCFFTCGIDIGNKILNRLNEIFVETTELGYGHGEEMFYLEILDEYYDDIVRSYGDYWQILNNFIVTKNNIHYIYNFILRKYIEMGFWREAYDCTTNLIYSIDNYYIHDNPRLISNIIFNHFVSAYYYKPTMCKEIYNKIQNQYMKNPLFAIEYKKNERIVEGYLSNLNTK